MKSAAKSIIGCGWRRSESHLQRGGGGGRRQDSSLDGRKELKLDATEMTFSREQLDALNRYLGDLPVAPSPDEFFHTLSGHKEIADVVERLVQRLLCGVGTLDRRFASKFLIKLHEEPSPGLQELETIQRYEYLVRLDAISLPGVSEGGAEDDMFCHLIDDTEDASLPQGYVKVLLQGEAAPDWAEFLTTNGLLRRDKIQERFVELLALSAGGASPTRPAEVDESLACGAPGKVADAGVIHQILKVPVRQQIFYGSAGNDDLRYPDPRDFRLAIVEEPAGVRLRIGFLSPAMHRNDDVQVYLILGIGFDGWPHSTDFPHRVDMTHPDFLIYYKTAQTGLYAVSIAPSPALRCESKSSIWRLCFPAARATLKTHYGPSSLPNKVLEVLYTILERLNRQEKLKLVNRNVLLTLLWIELEKSYSSPSKLLMHWLPETLSYHILKILDKLIIALRHGFQRSYFFPRQNIFHVVNNCNDEDCVSDTERLLTFLEHLYEESTLIQRFDHDKIIQDRVQTELIQKWVQVMADLAPPTTNRSRRLGFVITESSDAHISAASTQFTKKQLEYLKTMFGEMLRMQEIVSGNPYIFYDNAKLMYLINFILDQAVIYHNKQKHHKQHRNFIHKMNTQMEASKLVLFEAVAKELKLLDMHMENDILLVSQVLKWLYRALDEDKRFLAPILRPFLNRLFVASYENSWHIEAWTRREMSEELDVLGTFSRLVNEGAIKARTGVIDSANKGWYWAQDVLEIVQDYDLQLVFTPKDGTTTRCALIGSRRSFGFHTLKNAMSRNLDYTLRNPNNTKWMMTSTLPLKFSAKYQFPAQDVQDEHCQKYLTHREVRELSPMTRILESCRRYGQHRCLGDLMEALVALNKFSILQEISTMLPDAERLQMLDTIHRISKGTRRRHIRTLRSRSQSKPSAPSSGNSSTDRKTKTLHINDQSAAAPRASKKKRNAGGDMQTYTPTAESFLYVTETETRWSTGERQHSSTVESSPALELVAPPPPKRDHVKHSWQSLVTSNYFGANDADADVDGVNRRPTPDGKSNRKVTSGAAADAAAGKLPPGERDNWESLVRNNCFDISSDFGDVNTFKKVIEINAGGPSHDENLSTVDSEDSGMDYRQMFKKKSFTRL